MILVFIVAALDGFDSPLRPSTCQSVRMDFLALTPGVHSIETLTLTDVETGYAVNLRCAVLSFRNLAHADVGLHIRSVVDIVVHEPLEL